MKVIKLIWQRKYKVSYILKRELIKFDGTHIEMILAYNYNGDYIGNSRDAHFLCVKKNIHLELILGNTICTIGFSSKDKKWYGWSHRAIVGFKIGNMIFEEKFGNDHTPFIKHGRRKIKSLKDAKQSAINFARYIE